MQPQTLIIILLLAVTASCAFNINTQQTAGQDLADSEQHSPASEVPKSRSKRGIVWNFFQKMVITKNLIVDQFVDTKNTLNEVYNMINNQFTDPTPNKPTLPTTTTPETILDFGNDEESSSESTTTEAYKISRYELGRIIGRNYRGLQRLTEIEFKDALNATSYNIQEYKAEANQQFANSLAVEKKKQFKQFVG